LLVISIRFTSKVLTLIIVFCTSLLSLILRHTPSLSVHLLVLAHVSFHSLSFSLQILLIFFLLLLILYYWAHYFRSICKPVSHFALIFPFPFSTGHLLIMFSPGRMFLEPEPILPPISYCLPLFVATMLPVDMSFSFSLFLFILLALLFTRFQFRHSNSFVFLLTSICFLFPVFM